MSDEPEEITALRTALSFSEDNTALRKHLADTLMKYGRFREAEVEYQVALKADPKNSDLAAALADAYAQQEKLSEAFVIMESLHQAGTLSLSGKLLYVRLLSRTTELVRAAQIYKELKAEFPDTHDEEIEEALSPFLLEFADNDPNDPRRLLAGNQPGKYEAEVTREQIDFSEVGGMEAVKEQIRLKIIHPLGNAKLYQAYGKKIGGGILLYGPPGCGKTHLARATAGEVKARFISVGLHDVLDMWIGQSEKNLHDIFEQARDSAPCVLFFDEVDALGSNRSDMRNSAGRHTINQFLSELDGIEASNDGVLILAATNAPWHVDTAFRRPGRFDRMIFVPPPDHEARRAILKIMLNQKPVKDIDYDVIAKKVEGFSGADLKALVDQAVEDKLQQAMASGDMVPITTKDLTGNLKKVKPSTKEWFATAKNHALYANQSGIYDEILEFLKIRR